MKSFQAYGLVHYLVLMELFSCYVEATGILKGLPFNLPNTKFCTPCKKHASRFYYPSSKQDEFCLKYNNEIESPHSKVYFQLFQLLQSLNSVKSPFSYVVHAYIESMRTYQSIFKMPYDLSVLVVPTLDDTSCLKFFKSGVGFLRQNVTRDQIRKIHPSDFIEHTNGRKWEFIFLNGMEDVWAYAYCNNKNHKRFYLSSRRRVQIASDQSRYWMFRPIGPYDSLNPSVDPVFFRECGENTTVPKALADDAKRCTGQLECQINPIVADHPYAQPNPVQQPSGYRSYENATTISGTSQVAVKKQKLDLPTVVINEFNPLKSDPYHLEEFVEIRVHPPPLNDQFHFKAMKLIAVTAYSERLLLVINLHNLPVPPEGYFVLRSSAVDNKQFIHVSSDNHEFKLLPGYEKEPVALLLLRNVPSVTAKEWENIKLKPQRSLLPSSKRVVHSRDLSAKSEANTWNVIRQTVIDAQLYGKNLNQQLSEQLTSVLPSTFSGCNFIIPIGDVANSEDMEASLNLCNPSNHVKPFQYNFFKLGSFTIGSLNDCSRPVPYQVARSEHSEQLDVDTIGVTNSPTSPEQCPSENNLSGLLRTHIVAEIELIKRRYNQKYTTPLFPTDTFKTTTWHEIMIQESSRCMLYPVHDN